MSIYTELSVQQIPVPALIVDQEGVIVDLNEAAKYLTGYGYEEIHGQTVELLIGADFKAAHIKHRKIYQASSGVMTSIRKVDLQTKYSQTLVVNIRIAELEEHYLVMLYENDQIIENLHQSTLPKTHQILNAIDEAFWEWDIEEDVIHCSASMMSLLGYKAQDFIGPKKVLEHHLDKEVLAQLYLQIEEHLKGVIPNVKITYPFKNKQGKNIWLTVVGKVIDYKNDRASRMIGTVKDVTDSKQLIEQLKKKNNFLMLAEKLNNSGHWRYDLIDGSVFWSSEMYRIYGVDQENFTPQLENIINFDGDENERLKLRSNFDNTIAEIKGYYNKCTITQPNGPKRKIETIGEVEINNKGEVVALFGICRDITKSEEVFEKLKLLAMVNLTIKVPIFFIDDDDNVVYQDLSPQAGGKNSVLFNYINFSITEYLDFKKQAKLNGQMKQINISFDKYNTVFDLSVTYESDEGIYIWIVENVTDKFRQEQQQIISNRLALLGNTFGNVSHDINNVLGVALGAIEMLEMKFAKGEDISSYIDRVKNAIDKGKSVTERLLAFTRKPTIKVVSFDPLEDIKDNQHLFKQLLLSTINLTFDFENIHCLINFPQGEFINILLNLVLNAQDAIQEKGLSGQIVISANLGEENRLEIHVKDSGIGIKKENLTKIFDPFYSSKSVNKGNGIGLANVFNTMYKHNGHVQVEGHSDLGGANFTLVFKCKVLKSHYQKPETQAASLNMLNKRILVLDDEVSIADFVALFLENEGADVTCANTKEQLLDILSKNDNFDLFITDMILPDLSGKEAVDYVLEKFPQIKIYSISGYIAIEDRSWDYPVLRKPFNSKELAEFLSH
ncbi:MAG: PAS domain S-box protein [Colwellia sp.]|nr:PAS domain S-box protein [Colwellia sp.]